MPVNYGGGYDSGTYKFVCPSAGTYWIFATMTWPGTTYGMCTMYGPGGGGVAVNFIQRLHTTFSNTDTMSRDVIRTWNAGQAVFITSAYPLYADSSSSFGPGFGGFQLDSTVSTQVFFNVTAFLCYNLTIERFFIVVYV